MKFTKMHGIGNDYVYVNGFAETIRNPEETARLVSDRHFGIGSDGLILIKPSEKADFEMDMYNADGSRGAMCGNGIRCVAKYVYDYGLTDKTRISVDTRSGVKYLDLTVENHRVTQVKVNMGNPVFEPKKIPVLSEKDRVINESIQAADREWKITVLSMGNPHGVIFTEDVDTLDLEKIGQSSSVILGSRTGSTRSLSVCWMTVRFRCASGSGAPGRPWLAALAPAPPRWPAP